MEKKRYIIRTAGCNYVGLFNYGRSYQAARTKCIVKETPERARAIASAFRGTLTEVV